MPILTDLDRFRLQLGDTNAADPLFNDDEAQHFIASTSSTAAAVAMAVDALTLRFAREYDVTVDGQSFNRSQIAQVLSKHGERLQDTAGREVETMFVTRIDAYSDDVRADDTHPPIATDGYDLDEDHDIPS